MRIISGLALTLLLALPAAGAELGPSEASQAAIAAAIASPDRPKADLEQEAGGEKTAAPDQPGIGIDQLLQRFDHSPPMAAGRSGQRFSRMMGGIKAAR